MLRIPQNVVSDGSQYQGLKEIQDYSTRKLTAFKFPIARYQYLILHGQLNDRSETQIAHCR